jgi:hypothetical protein
MDKHTPHIIPRISDNRIQIWNLLHDGEITALSEGDGETLTMFVSIPYLRRRLEPLGDSFVLTLSGLTRLEFEDFDGVATPFREEMKDCDIDILLTESESMPATIEVNAGKLTLEYQSIHFALDTGRTIEYEEIEKVCDEYWTEWATDAERRSHSASQDDER